jgi:uncharacterized protein (TIGR02246 family)
MPADEEQIRQALALWSQTDADKDAEGFAALFTEDGSYISKRGVSKGTAALRANLADRTRLNPPDRRTMHLLAEPLIEVTGDTATAVSPYVGYGRIGDSPWEIMSVGRIHTKLVRAADGWLFTQVENRSIGPAGGPATIRHAPSV